MTTCLLILSGCNNSISKYHAEIFDNIGEYVNEEFLRDNVLLGVTPFENRNDSIPEEIIFTVKNEDELHKIFNDTFDPNIDFDSQIFFVYTYTAINMREQKISKIDYNNKNIKIFIKDKNYHSPAKMDTTNPYQRWIGIKMDKVDFDLVEVKW